MCAHKKVNKTQLSHALMKIFGASMHELFYLLNRQRDVEASHAKFNVQNAEH